MVERGLVILIASAFQGLTGFGFGIIAVALLTLVMDPKEATILCTLMALCNIAQILWGVWRHVRLSVLAPLAIGSVVSMPFGVKLLGMVSGEPVRMTVGVVLVIVALWELFSPKGGTRREASWPLGLVVGVAGGFLGGFISMSGPPAIVYAYTRRWSAVEIKALLQSFFLITTCWRLGLLVANHMILPETVWCGVLLVPVSIVGTQGGIRIFSRMRNDSVLLVARVSILVLGVYLLV